MEGLWRILELDDEREASCADPKQVVPLDAMRIDKKDPWGKPQRITIGQEHQRGEEEDEEEI